ncbi:UvrD-helicase domain-containing protein [Stackebrandtia soli]|uniref:UvrD-helicase domain-containing protein n=1 Tax=Stackebrandtia soli TaxID=1892856 RepID=UPI0039E8E93F
MSVHLRLTEAAAEDIRDLDPQHSKAYIDFDHKIRQNKNHGSLRFKALSGHKNLYSARVGGDYRALMVHAGNDTYVVVAVQPRSTVYERLERGLRFEVNHVTGQFETIEPEVARRLAEQAAPARPERDPQPKQETVPGVLDGFTDDELSKLGVSRALLPAIRDVKDDSGLVTLADALPPHTADVLMNLATGMSIDEVMENITDPARPDDPVDPADMAAAVERTTSITTSDLALQAIHRQDFAKWRMFLHPSQNKLVTKNYRGPARVSGGPGTGKTVVALHRTARLAREHASGTPILLTSFNVGLAKHLKRQLGELLTTEEMKRVEVVNIDSLAMRIAKERGIIDTSARPLDDTEAKRWWQTAMDEAGDREFGPDFCHEEWTEVVCGNIIDSRDGYLRVRRAGRSHRLSRPQRVRFWKVCERFTARLEEEKRFTYPWLSARTAVSLNGDSTASRPRYRHVLVDEAQDMSAAQWRLLRALVPERENDMFIAGDSHQRIYGAPLALGPLGINIVGRSTRLTLSYRTTQEILQAAIAMVSGESFDDLDNGVDHLTGYRSVRYGPAPNLIGAATRKDELAAVVEEIRAWTNEGVDPSAIAICTPTKTPLEEIRDHLTGVGIATVPVQDGTKGDGVRLSTMHGLKGLEFERIVIAGVGAAEFPRPFVRQRRTDPAEHRRLMRKERSLLFVAASRARDALSVTWTGKPCEFLEPLL